MNTLRTKDLVDAYFTLLPHTKFSDLSDPDVRRPSAMRRILLLLEHHAPDDPALLVPMLDSQHASVTAAAIKSLSRVQDLPDALVGSVADVATRSSKSLRLNALAALAKGHGPEALRQYRKFLISREEAVREDAIAALDPESPNFAETLRKALADPSPGVRKIAIARAALKQREPVGDNSLTNANCDSGLGLVRTTPLPEDFVALLLATRDHLSGSQGLEEVLPIALTLLTCEEPQRADHITTELTLDLLSPTNAKRTIAVDTLRRLVETGNGKVVGEKVLDLLKKYGWQSTDEGILAIAGISSASAIPQVLLKGIESENDKGRILLIDELFERGLHPAPLVKMLENLLEKDAPDFYVYYAAVVLIKAGKDALPSVRRLIASGPLATRTTLIEVLTPASAEKNIKKTATPVSLDADTVAAVIAAANSEAEELKTRALALIGHLSNPPPNLQALLAAGIRDTDMQVREAAASAWLRQRLQINRDEVSALFLDSSYEVRKTAIKLVGLMPKGPAQIEILKLLIEKRRQDAKDDLQNARLYEDVLETTASAGSAGLKLVNTYLPVS